MVTITVTKVIVETYPVFIVTVTEHDYINTKLEDHIYVKYLGYITRIQVVIHPAYPAMLRCYITTLNIANSPNAGGVGSCTGTEQQQTQYLIDITNCNQDGRDDIIFDKAQKEVTL